MFENIDLKAQGDKAAAKPKEGRRNTKTKMLLSLLASVFVGVVITLLSGLIQTPMGHLGVDVIYWGVPLSWTMRVIPTRFQSIDWLNLAADCIFWIIVASIASMSLLYIRSKSNHSSPR